MAGPTTLDGSDVVDVTFIGKLYGSTILNTLHYFCEPTAWYNPSLVTGYTDIIAALQLPAGVRDKFVACCTADYSLEAIQVQVIRPTRKAYFRQVDGTAGTLGTSAKTSNTAANLELRSLFADKPSFRSFWIPGVPTDMYADGELTPTYQGYMDTLGQRLKTVLTVGGGSNLVPVLYSPAAVVNYTRSVEFYTVKPEVRVLTRRTKGRGI